ATSDVQVARANQASFVKGAAATLTAGQLGNGGAVTANSDGSYDISFPVGGDAAGGFGVAMGVSTLADGDQLQLTIQVADAASGDVSTSPATMIKIGQPPTVTSLAASSTTSGRPLISFRYNQGVGGSSEYN